MFWKNKKTDTGADKKKEISEMEDNTSSLPEKKSGLKALFGSKKKESGMLEGGVNASQPLAENDIDTNETEGKGESTLPPPDEGETFHIPYSPHTESIGNTKITIKEERDATTENMPAEKKLSDSGSLDKRSEEALKAIELQMEEGEKPKKKDRASAKKHKKESAEADQKSVLPAENIPSNTAEQVSELSLINEEIGQPVETQAGGTETETALPEPAAATKKNAEAGLLNDIEVALNNEEKANNPKTASLLQQDGDGGEKVAPKARWSISKFFRKKNPELPEAAESGIKTPDEGESADVDLLNAEPKKEIKTASDAPERNVVALYKSIGLSANDIPASERPKDENEIKLLTDEPKEDAPKNEVSADNTDGKGNMLVSAIIETAKKSQEERNKVLGGDFSDQVTEEDNDEEKKKIRHERLLIIGRFCAGFSLLLPICSWIIFQSVLDPDSKISSILKAENHGAIHAAMLTKKTEKEEQLALITKEITGIQEKTNNIRDNKVLKQILDNRIDFLEIMLGVNKTTLKALNLTPELNNAIHMLTFNSFTGSLKPGSSEATITISGSVRDPKRLSMSKLTYLIEAINGDEHLDGIELRTFAKSEDEQGGSQSSFNFNFAYSANDDPGAVKTVQKPVKKKKK